MTLEKIIKFIDNKCTDSELMEIIEWINSEAFEEKKKDLAFSIWNTFSTDELDNDATNRLNQIFDNVQNKINPKPLSLTLKGTNQSRKSYFRIWLTRIAAILFIPLLAVHFHTLFKNTEIKKDLKEYANLPVDTLETIVPSGSRTVIHLSDGTTAHLNFGSKLKYPQKFNGDTREVILTGEGYFEVAHNPQKPFIVRTSELDIKALGTDFNVTAYTGTKKIETTLIAGKIVIEKKKAGGQTCVVSIMEPGQHIKYNIETNTYSSSKGDIEKYYAWKDGKLIFNNTNILEVAEKLSSKFNVNIDVNENISDYNYSVIFDNELLSQILDLMSIATPIQYLLHPRERLDDGTYTKQRITLTQKQQ